MSLYKDASLVMIPSAYKDGKLYSIRPTDGSGDFTFSRGSNLAATRVDVNGLIEKGRENEALYSNTFTSWVQTSISLTANQSGYDNSSDAWLIESTATNGAAYINRNHTHSGVFTISVYAKKGTSNWMALATTGSHFAHFDLENGVVGIATGANIIDHTIQSVGNGWYRCSMTSRGFSNYYVFIANGDNDRNTNSGDNIYIQDFQLEAGLVATDYIETGASTAQAGILEDMPRLDYSGSCPALLLEPQRTNKIAQSEYVVRNVGGWDINSDLAITTENNSTTSPQGLQNAAKLIYSGSGYSYARQSLTAGAGTLSVYVKKGNWRYIGLRNGENQSTHSVFDFDTESFVLEKSGHTLGYESVGNGWYRIWDYQPTAVSPANGLRGVAMCDANGTENSPSTPSGSYNYVWGFQFEAGASYPTSYIPTYGSSVTRSDDYMQVTPTNLLGSDIGAWYLELDDWSFEVTGTQVPTIYLGDDTQNCLALEAKTLNGIKNIHLVKEENNTSTTLYSFTLSGKTKICFVWDGTTLKIFKDGSSVYSATNFTQPTNWDEFVYNYGSREAMMRIPNINLFPTALTDSECIALTTL